MTARAALVAAHCALGAAGCGAAGGPAAPAVPPDAVSASPSEVRPCAGATAIPPEVDQQLTRLASPMRDHCELHALGRARALFVRTMDTVAHDDRGDPIATCQWEVFSIAPGDVRHLGSLSACRFRVADGCAIALDGGPQRLCLP